MRAAAAVAAGLACIAAAGAAPPAALAHAVLLRSDPPDLCLRPGGESLPLDSPGCRAGAVLVETPRMVRLVFNEPVQPIGRGLRVIGPDGRRVDRGAVRVAGPEVAVDADARSPGAYRVVWSVISADTHPDFGAMTFSVRRPGGVIAGTPGAGGGATAWGLPLGALAHLLHFAGYALGFGAFTAAWLVRGPAMPRALWRLTASGIGLLLVAEPLAFAAESAALGAFGGGADPAVVGAVLDSSFGRVLSQRAGAAILLWVLAGAIRSGALRTLWSVPALGAALAFVDGEAAHATGVRPVWWGLAVNAVHVGAMGLWAGTLAFALLAPPVRREGDPREPVSGAGSAPARLALTGGIAAVLSGVVMAAQHLTGLRDLAVGPYGRTLVLKAGAVAAAAVLARFGWRGVHRGGRRRVVWWETAAMLGVLALAAVLVLLRPPVP